MADHIEAYGFGSPIDAVRFTLQFLRDNSEHLLSLLPEGSKVLVRVQEGQPVCDVIILKEKHVVRLAPGEKPYLELGAQGSNV